MVADLKVCRFAARVTLKRSKFQVLTFLGKNSSCTEEGLKKAVYTRTFVHTFVMPSAPRSNTETKTIIMTCNPILETLMPYIYLIFEQMLRNFLCFFQGPKFYNSLDSKITNANSVCSF